MNDDENPSNERPELPMPGIGDALDPKEQTDLRAERASRVEEPPLVEIPINQNENRS